MYKRQGQEFANCTEAFNAENIEFKYSQNLKELIDLQVKYTTNAENPAALKAVDYSMQAGGGLAIERVAVKMCIRDSFSITRVETEVKKVWPDEATKNKYQSVTLALSVQGFKDIDLSLIHI